MRKWFLIAGVLLVLTACCGAQTVNFDKKTDFYKYRTYQWISIPNAAPVEELTASQLTGTLEVELAKKGLAKAQSEKPDLYIGYQIVNSSGKKSAKIGLAYGGGVGGGNGSGTAMTTVHAGELVLDMYDASTKQFVWRGVVSNPVDREAKPDKRQKHMDNAVAKLLKDYPPKKT
jgi:uncharacterized protein DUF4136